MIPAVAGTSASGSNLLSYQWVSVGTSGSLYTSTSSTAASWTSRTSSFGTTNINDVCSNKYIYVAVGNSGKIATSTDGITWTQRTSGTTQTLTSVCWGGGYFVVPIINGGAYLYSADGITWTQSTNNPGTASIERCSWGNNTWVFSDPGLFGPAYYTMTTINGTMTQRTTTVAAGSLCRPYYWPAGSIWVGGADSGTTSAYESSPDGITWTSRNAPASQAGGRFAAGGNSSVLAVFARTGGNTTDCFSTTNGTTWTDRTPAETTSQSSQYTFLATDDTGLLCYVPETTSKNVQTSSDGITWTNRGTITWSSLAVCHSNGLPGI